MVQYFLYPIFIKYIYVYIYILYIYIYIYISIYLYIYICIYIYIYIKTFIIFILQYFRVLLIIYIYIRYLYKIYVTPQKDQANQNLFNYWTPDNCPLDNKCLTFKILYSAEITTDHQKSSIVYLEIRFILKLGLKITKIFPTSAEWKRYRTLQVHLGAERQTHGISD